MLYSESLPKSPTSAALARDLLDRVRPELPAPLLDDARLLVSELVANAVEHVIEDGDIGVRVELADSRLRVEVRDPGPGFAYTPRAANAGGSDRGWGLVFAERVASRWGNGPGLVWFELDRS
jgi:anti-sigma regulatory factor (Ser/Thr protein kinase)